ncbi:MAG: TetR/AcrR family transcriptional regulator [Oscillospiraceae bacterium]
MGETKENILIAALHLFAKNGFEAVSMSRISGELGITKGALYKHYASKREVFDSIVERMERMDGMRVQQYEVPEGTYPEAEESYSKTTMSHLTEFGIAQFRYWTEDDFASSFRRMLTLEQYRDEETGKLYQQYLVSGPLGYVADIFRSWNIKDAEKKAVEFYSPMFLFYGIYDGADDKAAVSAEFVACMKAFSMEIQYAN